MLIICQLAGTKLFPSDRDSLTRASFRDSHLARIELFSRRLEDPHLAISSRLRKQPAQTFRSLRVQIPVHGDLI